MQAYETAIMSYRDIKAFTKWFDEEIGTDYDLNKEDGDAYYAVFFELTQSEVEKCRDYENNNDKLIKRIEEL